MSKYLSIIVPVYNEAENLRLLNDKIKEALSSQDISYEVIYVDDCSNDGSYEVLQELAKSEENVTVVKFKRNFGQTAAMSAGFDYANGEIIVPIDADLQNDPQDILPMIEKYKKGYDIVSGWRKSRKDNAIRNVFSQIANKLISNLTGTNLHDSGCTLKVYNAKILKNIKLYGELHRFIPALAALDGATIVEMPVRHHPRIHGQSKYNLSRTSRVISDLLTIMFLKNYRTKPMHFFGGLALGTFLLILGSLFLLLLNAYIPIITIDYALAAIIEIIFFVFALQLICLGLVSEILMRSYYESQNKKIYTIDKTSRVE